MSTMTVLMTNLSITSPTLQLTSFLPPHASPFGPQINSPAILVAPKVSLVMPCCMNRCADHAGLVHDGHRHEPDCEKRLPPVPTVRCVTRCCGKDRS